MSPYVAGVLLLDLLSGEDTEITRALICKVEDPWQRSMLRRVAAAPQHERESLLEQNLAAASNGEAQTMREMLAFARTMGLQACKDALEAKYPVPPGVSLETAGADFTDTEWLWPNWIPLGYVTILAGQAGVGKSMLALSLAEAALGLAPWPDGTRTQERDRHSEYVVWLDTEASQPLLYERASERNLPLNRFGWPLDPRQEGVNTPSWRLDDARQFKILSAYVERLQPPLVVIDSLSGAHAGNENSSDMRLILQRVSEMARDQHTAVLLTHHIRKSGEGEQSHVVGNLERLRGSSAIFQFARCVIGVDAPQTDNPSHLRFRQLKNNLAAMTDPLGAVLEKGRVVFGGPAPIEAKRWSPVDDAREFLAERLSNSAAPVLDILAEAKGRGISQSAVNRASRIMKVVKVKRNESGRRGGGEWVWSLRADRAGEVALG